jgi:hypothetical protein
MSNFFTEHKTALSGAATILVGVLSNPQALNAINPTWGGYATMAMGAITGAIGIYNSFKQARAAQSNPQVPSMPTMTTNVGRSP